MAAQQLKPEQTAIVHAQHCVTLHFVCMDCDHRWTRYVALSEGTPALEPTEQSRCPECKRIASMLAAVELARRVPRRLTLRERIGARLGVLRLRWRLLTGQARRLPRRSPPGEN